MIHELKTLPQFFKRVIEGDKTFEVRKNDRDFQVNDILKLNEWDNEKEIYTGRIVFVKVIYILPGGQFGIKEGYCVMSIIIND